MDLFRKMRSDRRQYCRVRFENLRETMIVSFQIPTRAAFATRVGASTEDRPTCCKVQMIFFRFELVVVESA